MSHAHEQPPHLEQDGGFWTAYQGRIWPRASAASHTVRIEKRSHGGIGSAHQYGGLRAAQGERRARRRMNYPAVTFSSRKSGCWRRRNSIAKPSSSRWDKRYGVLPMVTGTASARRWTVVF